MQKSTHCNIVGNRCTIIERDWSSRFKPARWLDLPPKCTGAYSTLTFLAGPHACIGKTMAIIEMKAVLGCVYLQFIMSA